MSTLESLEQDRIEGGLAALDRRLLPLEAGLAALPVVRLDVAQVEQLRHGQRFILAGTITLPLCQAVDGNGRLIALVAIGVDGGISVRRGFNPPAQTVAS